MKRKIIPHIKQYKREKNFYQYYNGIGKVDVKDKV